MATFDMTSRNTAGVAADQIAAYRSGKFTANLRMVEAVLDISKVIAGGATIADGDIFQLLEVPAGNLVLFAGAEVETAFDGTSPTVNIDFAAGDDIVDGGDVSATGFLASGTNGQANAVTTGAASTFTQFVATADTIDVTLAAASSDVTEGVLRVYACVVDCNEYGGFLPTEVVRDQLA